MGGGEETQNSNLPTFGKSLRLIMKKLFKAIYRVLVLNYTF